jgi:hypothetical protein
MIAAATIISSIGTEPTSRIPTMSPVSFCGCCRGGGVVACAGGGAPESGGGACGVTACGANRCASAIAINSHATTTASPISSTRQLGRPPLPRPIISGRSPAVGKAPSGSRIRAMTATVISASVPVRAAITKIIAARLPPAAASGPRSIAGKYPRSAAATVINSTIRATTRPVGLSMRGIGTPLNRLPAIAALGSPHSCTSNARAARNSGAALGLTYPQLRFHPQG